MLLFFQKLLYAIDKILSIYVEIIKKLCYILKVMRSSILG